MGLFGRASKEETEPIEIPMLDDAVETVDRRRPVEELRFDPAAFDVEPDSAWHMPDLSGADHSDDPFADLVDDGHNTGDDSELVDPFAALPAQLRQDPTPLDPQPSALEALTGGAPTQAAGAPSDPFDFGVFPPVSEPSPGDGDRGTEPTGAPDALLGLVDPFALSPDPDPGATLEPPMALAGPAIDAPPPALAGGTPEAPEVGVLQASSVVSGPVPDDVADILADLGCHPDAPWEEIEAAAQKGAADPNEDRRNTTRAAYAALRLLQV